MTMHQNADVRAKTDRAAPHGERGTVLLLALIVMSSVVLSSMGLGSLIVSSLQQSRIIDSASVAYYAAESGAEEALYQARRKDTLPATVATAQTLGNNASWKRTVNTMEDVVYAGTLKKDSFIEVALYDPAAGTPTGVGRVDVSWTPTCVGCGTLSASVVGWQPGMAWDALSTASTEFATYAYPASPASIVVPSTTKLYRLRLHATGSDLNDVRIHGYTPGGAAMKLPGRVQVDSRGTFAGVEQKLLVTIPRKMPLSGAFDYVVFSECSIVKGGTITCP
ncbi:MAG: hypothetical protein RLZZ324_234 [Candidatus Parcubacteria bacterium]|jgi:Tfp pilus assembly protein PilX